MAKVVRITGIQQVNGNLNKLKNRSILRPPMAQSVQMLQRYMARYPSAPAGSSYTRTGTLGRRWVTRIKQTARGLLGEIGNNTPYGPFVQSERFQARIHRGRWQTDEDAIRENESAIIRFFERALKAAWGL